MDKTDDDQTTGERLDQQVRKKTPCLQQLDNQVSRTVGSSSNTTEIILVNLASKSPKGIVDEVKEKAAKDAAVEEGMVDIAGPTADTKAGFAMGIS